MADETKQEPQVQQQQAPKESPLPDIKIGEVDFILPASFPVAQISFDELVKQQPKKPLEPLQITDPDTYIDPRDGIVKVKLSDGSTTELFAGPLNRDGTEIGEMIRQQREYQRMQKSAYLAAAHSVSSYEKVNGGTAEVNGPLTLRALRDLGILTASADPAVKTADYTFNQWQEFKETIGVKNGEDRYNDIRAFVQSERDADGKIKARIVMGHIDDALKNVEVDRVYNLETGQTTEIKPIVETRVAKIAVTDTGSSYTRTETPVTIVENKGFVIPLSDKGVLQQAAATDLVNKLHDLPTLEIAKFNKVGNEKSTISEIMGPIPIEDFRKSTSYRNMPTETQEKFDAVFESVRRTQGATSVIVQNDIDAATKETTTRIHIGRANFLDLLHGARENNTDRLTGDLITPMEFSKSFNVENGKPSNFEEPLKISISGDRLRQKTADEFVEKVRAAIDKGDISQLAPEKAHPFKALVPDALPAGGLAYSGVDGNEPFTPGTTSAKTKAPVVPGKKPAEVA